MTLLRTSLLLSVWTLLGLTPSVEARLLLPAPQSIPQRTINSPVVLIGKVTAIEDQPVMASPDPTVPMKTEYRIAVVKVEEGLVGTEGLTHLRIGFQVPQAQPAPQPPVEKPLDPNAPPIAVRPRPVRPKLPTWTPQVGQEGLIFLRPHHSGDFYISLPLLPPVFKDSESYADDVAIAKTTLQVLADPLKALQAKNAEDRHRAALLLLMKYRSYPENVLDPAKVIQQPIPAAESRAIVQAVVEMDWNQFDKKWGLHSQMGFGMLGLTEQDGWMPPKFNGQPNYNVLLENSAKEWLKANLDTFRVKRFVVQADKP